MGDHRRPLVQCRPHLRITHSDRRPYSINAHHLGRPKAIRQGRDHTLPPHDQATLQLRVTTYKHPDQVANTTNSAPRSQVAMAGLQAHSSIKEHRKLRVKIAMHHNRRKMVTIRDQQT